LLHYLQNGGYFIQQYQDSSLTVLKRLKLEPDDREVAVISAKDYILPVTAGTKFGQPRLSPVYPQPKGGFKQPPFSPGNHRPPEDWPQTETGSSSLVRLDLQPSPSGIALAARYIYIPITVEEHQDVELVLGSDDTLEVWFNGKSLLKHTTPRAARLGDNTVKLLLKPGVNHLYFRVDNIGGAWRFIAELRSPKKS
jgi:hypothetical protein